VEEDFQSLLSILAEVEQMQDEQPPEQAQQLSLF
jgi:hypothetical protein